MGNTAMGSKNMGAKINFITLIASTVQLILALSGLRLITCHQFSLNFALRRLSTFFQFRL